MSNLLDSLKSYITPELISQAAAAFGENESGVQKAALSLAPTMLAGLLNKSNDQSGLESVFNLISKFDSGVLDNLGGLIGGGNLAHNDPKDAAGEILGHLFGSKVPAINNSVAAFSGVKSSTVSSLLGLVGPLVMGWLSKKIKTEGLSLSGLMNFLGGEKNAIMGALPGGLGALLGFSGANVDADASVDAPAAGGTRWLWPLLLLLALAAGIMYYLKNCKGEVKAPEKAVTTVIDSTAIKAAAAAEAAKNATVGYMKKLASGFEIKGNATGIESQLIAFIEDASKPVDKTTWFNFDRLNFRTGSAELDMEKSQDQLNNIYEVLKAFPKVKIRIGGYTDNTGNKAANMKLSTDRANNVMNALLKMGIDKARLSAEGYGDQHPAASNDTEEGRAQNRRIAVRVTEK